MTRSIEDWRHWIAENLLLGTEPVAIARALAENGLSQDEAVSEVNAAIASPYLQGSARLRNRLTKRDWAMSVYGRLSRLRRDAGTVGRRERLPREEFFEDYYCQNRPVIITGMFDSWRARKEWDFDYFREICGDATVEVQFGRESDPDYEINGPKHKRLMRFGDYVDLVERTGSSNDFYMTANNTSHNREALAVLWNDIETIEEYLDPKSPDTGFFWLGPAGTLTPFHHDLTNNFMAQVIGRKRVKMIPLCDTPYVYNDRHCFSRVDGGSIDLERFPDMQNAQVVECALEPGELLFIPIGWWHYVEGLEASVTMSFTNFRYHNDFFSGYSTYDGI